MVYTKAIQRFGDITFRNHTVFCSDTAGEAFSPPDLHHNSPPWYLLPD